MVATVPAKRGRKPAPAAAAAQTGGQVQSLTRGLTLLEFIAEAHGLSLIHISEPTRRLMASRMPSSA